jgi:hypothetical protein
MRSRARDAPAAFLRSAAAHLHLPLLLALWTGQRQGDLLRGRNGRLEAQDNQSRVATLCRIGSQGGEGLL